MTDRPKNFLSRILAVIGPGLFLIGYNIGTGSITTMASAGSRWGLTLTWAIVLSCVFTFICIWAFSKYTLVTGNTILYAIRKNFIWGRQISFFILCAVIFAEFMGITGLMSVVVDLIHEWFFQVTGINSKIMKFGIDVFLTAGLFILLWRCKYQMLERALSLLVILMGLSFLLTLFLVAPSLKSICKGLVPQIPDTHNGALLISGIAGTTLSSAMLYCRSITLKEKGWRLNKTGNAAIDSIVSVSMMFLLGFAVMACAAGTLYAAGTPVERAIDMVKTLEPLAGSFASAIFILGIVGAGVSSLIPTILIAPWLLSDFNNSRINPRSKGSRIFVITGLLIALAAPFLRTEPVILMIITMALLAVILPLTTISITILLNQKKYMGKNRNSFLMNMGCGGAIIFSIIMCYYGIVGLFEYL